MKKWIPEPYQKFCVEEGKKRNLAFFLDPGLGKTSIMLAIYCWLKKYKKSKGALVIAPINPMYLTWPDEIKDWSNFAHLKYIILRGFNKFPIKRKADIWLIHPEGLDKLFSILSHIPPRKWPFDTIFIDESSKFKSTTSNRTKLLMKNIRYIKHRYIANGTPTGNGYEGLFSQMFLVDLGKSLGARMGEYREKYFKQFGKTEWRSYALKNKDTYKEILEQIKPSAICIEAEDHIEVPQRLIIPRFIDIPPKALKVYKEIETELFSVIDEQDFVAQTASTMSTMLHQICNGNLYYTQDPLEEYKPPLARGFNELHKEKLKALEDLIDEANGQQVLIGYKFKSDKEVIKKYFGKKIVMFSDQKDTNKTQKDWNSGKTRLLAGQISAIGFGLNLQKSHAHIVALYSLMADFEAFDQFIRRLARRGNTSNRVYVYPIIAKGLYDHEVVYKKLKDRDRAHKSTFQFLKEYKAKRGLA